MNPKISSAVLAEEADVLALLSLRMYWLKVFATFAECGEAFTFIGFMVVVFLVSLMIVLGVGQLFPITVLDGDRSAIVPFCLISGITFSVDLLGWEVAFRFSRAKRHWSKRWRVIKQTSYGKLLLQIKADCRALRRSKRSLTADELNGGLTDLSCQADRVWHEANINLSLVEDIPACLAHAKAFSGAIGEILEKRSRGQITSQSAELPTEPIAQASVINHAG